MNNTLALFSSLFAVHLATLQPAAAFEVVTEFDASLGEMPESVTTDAAGNLYASVGNTIRRVTSQGEVSVFGTLPIPVFALGLKVGNDGCVYAVSTSLSEIEGAFVWRLCSEGKVEEYAALDPSGAPNDLAFDDHGNLFVTDAALGQIWRISPDQSVEVWLEDPVLEGNPDAPVLVFGPVGADGIVFDRAKRKLFVSNLDYGHIVEISLWRRGDVGRVSILTSDPLLEGVDGLALDNRGNLYAAINAQDRLVSISRCGRITVLGEGGLLDGPSSMVFGVAPGDRHTLYFTSSAFSRTMGFQIGTPRPSLLSFPVRFAGLPLP